MRKTILTLSVALCLFSCEKSYRCEHTIIAESPSFNSETTDYVDFKGTKEEKQAFEELYTYDIEMFGTLTRSIMVCK